MKDILKKELESKKSNIKTMKVSYTGIVPAIGISLPSVKSTHSTTLEDAATSVITK